MTVCEAWVLPVGRRLVHDAPRERGLTTPDPAVREVKAEEIVRPGAASLPASTQAFGDTGSPSATADTARPLSTGPQVPACAKTSPN